MFGGDFSITPTLRNADVRNGAEGACRTVGFIEKRVVELVLALAEFGATSDDSFVEFFGRNDAVGKEFYRCVYTTDVVALILLGI